MSELKHTPGPWYLTPDAADGKHVIYGGEDKTYRVATAHNFNGMAQNKANARLIAAAPELLAFARWCISKQFDSRDIGWRAQEAIAKATGEQP